MTNAKHRTIILLVLATLSALAVADDEPSATPYRPTVSTPAALSAPGWIEAEFGAQRSHGGDLQQRDSLPYSLKYAFTPDWGIRLSGDSWVRNVEHDSARTSGIGDTALILKRRFALDQDVAFGLEGGVNVPTAKDSIGSGKTDYLLNGIFSANFGEYHTDINLSVTRLGRVSDTQGRMQAGWAVSLSRPVDDRWGIAGELSGTRRKDVASTQQALLALNYNYTKRIVFDVGAALGLNHATPDWTAFAGMTILLNRIQ